MAAWNEAPAAGGLGECAALVRSAEALRFSAPELAVQLARRALAVGAVDSVAATDLGQARALSMRAQAVFAAGLVRISHYVDAVEPAFAALALAESEGVSEVAVAVRLDLAACSREVGEPLLGCAMLRPVLETDQPRPSVRAVALGRLVGCIAHVGRRDDLEDALTEADRLLAADDGLSPDARRMERARLSVRTAAYHRWYGDTEDAAEAAREGLTQLNRLRERRADAARLRAQLVLELVCALLDDGALEEAASVSEAVLAEPVRATSAAAVGQLMLAVSTRVHLPSGRVERGRGLLDQAVWVADRHGLDGVLADALTVVSQLDESAGRTTDALESLRGARAAEQRRLRAMSQAARHMLTESGAMKWDATAVNALLRQMIRPPGHPIAVPSRAMLLTDTATSHQPEHGGGKRHAQPTTPATEKLAEPTTHRSTHSADAQPAPTADRSAHPQPWPGDEETTRSIAHPRRGTADRPTQPRPQSSEEAGEPSTRSTPTPGERDDRPGAWPGELASERSDRVAEPASAADEGQPQPRSHSGGEGSGGRFAQSARPADDQPDVQSHQAEGSVGFAQSPGAADEGQPQPRSHSGEEGSGRRFAQSARDSDERPADERSGRRSADRPGQADVWPADESAAERTGRRRAPDPPLAESPTAQTGGFALPAPTAGQESGLLRRSADERSSHRAESATDDETARRTGRRRAEQSGDRSPAEEPDRSPAAGATAWPTEHPVVEQGDSSAAVSADAAAAHTAPDADGPAATGERAEPSAGALVSATADRLHGETDEATGLLNKEGLIRRLRAVRNGERPVALTLVRLDSEVGPGRFADPGTRPGAATDFELSELAGRVRNIAPDDAELARSDGTELAVLLPHTTRDQAEKFAAAIESAWLGTANSHSISTGVVQSNPDAPTVDARALINAARHALTPAVAAPRGPSSTPPNLDDADPADTLRIGRAIISSLSIPTGSGGRRRADDGSPEPPDEDPTTGAEDKAETAPQQDASSTYEQTKADLARLMAALKGGGTQGPAADQPPTPLPAPSRPTEDHPRNGTALPRQSIPTPPDPDEIPDPGPSPDIPDPTEPEPVPPTPPDPGPQPPDEPGPLTPPSATEPVRRRSRLAAAFGAYGDIPDYDTPNTAPANTAPASFDSARSDSARSDSPRSDSAGLGSARSESERFDTARSDSTPPDSARSDSGRFGATDTESVRFDSTRFDAPRSDSARFGSAHSDTARSDSASSGSVRSDGTRSDTGRFDPTGTESARFDTARSDSTRSESERIDTADSESSRFGSTRSDSPRSDSAGFGSARSDGMHLDSARSESARFDSARSDTSSSDGPHADSARLDSAGFGSARSDGTHAGSASSDSGRFDVRGAESASFDSVRSDSTRPDSARFGSTRSDSAGIDSTRSDTAGIDSARSDTAGIDSARSDTAGIDSARSDAASADSTSPDSVRADSASAEPVRAPQADAARTDVASRPPGSGRTSGMGGSAAARNASRPSLAAAFGGGDGTAESASGDGWPGGIAARRDAAARRQGMAAAFGGGSASDVAGRSRPSMAAAFGDSPADEDADKSADKSADKTDADKRRGERSSTTIAGLLAEALAAYQETTDELEPPRPSAPAPDNDFDRLFDWRYQSPASGRHRSPE